MTHPYACRKILAPIALSLTAMMMAGLDGVQNKRDPGERLDIDMYTDGWNMLTVRCSWSTMTSECGLNITSQSGTTSMAACPCCLR